MDAAKGNENTALELYSWNAKMAGAVLEQLAHLEVLLRHAIDVQLSTAVRETEIGIPWFLLPPYYTAQPETIDKVRQRLRSVNQETRDQIVAGFTLGFWSGWFGSKHEDLWRDTLRRGFPNGNGTRKEISVLVEQIRKFRNRVAHHDSLLNVDVSFEMEAVFKLAAIINTDLAAWMKKVDRTDEVLKTRPIFTMDTVVVPASKAWPFYQQSKAYICQAGRFFQDVRYMAFYVERKVECEVPCVKKRYDNVLWNKSEAMRLQKSNNREDRKLGHIMKSGLGGDWPEGRYQVFLLSSRGDPQHVSLVSPLLNMQKGKHSAFVRKQRYTSINQLRGAKTVWDLV